MNDRFLWILTVVIFGLIVLIALEYLLGIVFPGLTAKLIYTGAALAIGYIAAKTV
jgi:hypothetical protein